MDSLLLLAVVVPNITALLTGTSLRRKHNVDQSVNSFNLKWIFNNVSNVKDYIAAPTAAVNIR
jgi:hypothetical protein